MTLLARAYWDGAPFRFRRAPAADVEPLVLRTADRREVCALLWRPSGAHPKTAVVALHPRVDFTRHYTFPALLAAGIACLGAESRSPNNDVDTVHEELLFDVAALVAALRDRGVERVVLLGNSGGGPLMAMYQAQAKRPPAERIARTPAGAPTRLGDHPLPPADALVYVAAHPGPGTILGECIDPSVAVEGDPHAIEPSLDMYDEANGFAPPPAWCSYDDAFVARFRAAQRERVARIDAIARAEIAAAADAAATGRQRRAHSERVLVVYRTMANLHYVDRRLDPSERDYGSLLSDRPDLMNGKQLGFARVLTPRAWLSTWSALSSQADMRAHLPHIVEPTLFVSAGADREIYPRSHVAPLVAALAAEDRTVTTIAGAGHYFEPEGSVAREELFALLLRWIRERFAS